MKNIIKWTLKRLIFIGLIQSITLLLFINLIGYNIYSKEVTYIKNKSTIILLGVSHVAENRYFEELNKKYSKINNLIVFTEGLNDLEGDEISHQYTAKIFGLSSQDSTFMSNYNRINMDISANELNNDVSNSLSSSFSVWQHLSIKDYSQSKIAINESGSLFKEKNLSIKMMYNEIILKRNIKLKEGISLNKENTILIPWGAIHHNDLHSFLISNGYEVKSTNYIKVANLLKIVFNTGKHFLYEN